MRQVYAKVFQSPFGAGIRLAGGHYEFSMNIDFQIAALTTACPVVADYNYHRPRCAPPSTCSTSPVTWLAPVR